MDNLNYERLAGDESTAEVTITTESTNNRGFVLKPSLSSLPLQVALFYNCIFSVIFVILEGASAIDKYTKYATVFQLAVLCIWFVLEPLRLYYGISGNITESVAHVSTFLLMTVFPQLALVCYLAYFQPVMYPVDPIIGSIMFIFQVFELYFGWLIMRTVVKNQTAQFMRLVEHED